MEFSIKAMPKYDRTNISHYRLKIVFAMCAVSWPTMTSDLSVVEISNLPKNHSFDLNWPVRVRVYIGPWCACMCALLGSVEPCIKSQSNNLISWLGKKPSTWIMKPHDMCLFICLWASEEWTFAGNFAKRIFVHVGTLSFCLLSVVCLKIYRA